MQQWDPKQYTENARFVSELGMPVVELLSPQPGERILDFGCGDGMLTINLAARGCEVVGVDSSPAMVAVARSMGANAHVIDGHRLPFVSEFDGVFSNAALHWMRYPEEVIAGVWQALKPGGRFVDELGGFGNVSSIVTAIEAALFSRGIEVPILGFSQGLRNIEGFFRPEDLRYRVWLLFLAQRPSQAISVVGLRRSPSHTCWLCPPTRNRNSFRRSPLDCDRSYVMHWAIGMRITFAYGLPRRVRDERSVLPTPSPHDMSRVIGTGIHHPQPTPLHPVHLLHCLRTDELAFQLYSRLIATDLMVEQFW